MVDQTPLMDFKRVLSDPYGARTGSAAASVRSGGRRRQHNCWARSDGALAGAFAGQQPHREEAVADDRQNATFAGEVLGCDR